MSGVAIVAALAVPALAFVAGMVTARKSARWCRVCGVTLACPVCGVQTD